MSGDFREFISTQLRLTILRLLAEDGVYTANSSVLASAVASMGFNVSRSQIRTELAWLKEQGLVTLTQPLSDLDVASISERGLDVAAGRARVPGVDRPTPKA